MSDQDTQQINRYLLGQLPREEAERIEGRLLTEPGLFELAESVEDEVIDRYVRGELAAEERRRFERRLLSSERIRERLQFARALAAHDARRAALPRPIDAGAAVVPLFRPAAARLAWAATLFVALLGGWLAFEVVRLDRHADALEAERLAAVERADEAAARARQAELVAERAELDRSDSGELAAELAAARDRLAELERRDLPGEAAGGERRVRRPGDYAEDAGTASLFIALATRSGSEPPTLRLDGAERARLELELAGPPPAEPVTAAVIRGGQTVWHEEGAEIVTDGGDSMAVLTLPRESLLPGRYRVELTAGAGPRLLGTYELTVVR
jgi:hypothetical protein